MKNRIFFLLFVVVIVMSASFWASSHPDGLEFVAEKLGFLDKGLSRTLVFTDYTIPGFGQGAFSTALAGMLGIGLCCGAVWLLSLGIRKKSTTVPCQEDLKR